MALYGTLYIGGPGEGGPAFGGLPTPGEGGSFPFIGSGGQPPGLLGQLLGLFGGEQQCGHGGSDSPQSAADVLRSTADLLDQVANSCSCGSGGEPPADSVDECGGAGESGGASESDNVNEELAADLLEMAKETSDPEDRMTLVKAAIEALGGNAESPASDGGETPASGGTDSPDGGCGCGEPSEVTYEGEDLRDHLRVEGGGTIGEEDGAYGVKDGPVEPEHAEIDLGEALTFTVPGDAGNVTGATVTLSDLYHGGPDGDYQETGVVIARDADGNVVGEYEVEGQTSDSPGEATVTIDKPFATLEFRPTGNGSPDQGTNSDFSVKSVTLQTDQPAGGTESASESSPSEASASGGEHDDQFIQQIASLLGQVLQLIDQYVQDSQTKNQIIDQVIGLLEQLGISEGATTANSQSVAEAA